eukprot:c13205_g1_i1 orf=4-165(-)
MSKALTLLTSKYHYGKKLVCAGKQGICHFHYKLSHITFYLLDHILDVVVNQRG